MTNIYAESLLEQILAALTGATQGWAATYSEAIGTATAAASFDIAVAVPAGARIRGCRLRVDTVLVSGDGGDQWRADYVDSQGLGQNVGEGLAFTKNTKHEQFYDYNADSGIAALATNVRVSCPNGTFSAGGVVRAVVYYETITAFSDAA